MIDGTWAYQAGSSGTVTLPVGSTLLSITAKVAASASGTIAIFGGTAIPGSGAVQTDTTLRFDHGLAQAVTGANTVVFASTVSYYVEYSKPYGT